ncbi:group II intron maturase-specific domain-containing protein [Dactylosporangium sp. CA-152071]|uniref:group II intron maturase-specific domain-containing protein n=1 Tax=Dactylosporangium sp. CA-152071 TaxID=3239933 RepID=UPI003D8D5781
MNQPLDELIRRLNQAVRGWCAYFRPEVSSATFAYLSHYLWQTVWRWLRRKHRRVKFHPRIGHRGFMPRGRWSDRNRRGPRTGFGG